MKLALCALVLAAGCHKAEQTKDDPARPVEPAAPSVTEPATPADAVSPSPTGSAGGDVGSAGGSVASVPAGSAVLVETIDQAVAAKGKHVRLRGIAQREKLGDTINLGDLRVLCVGAELPAGSIGTTVEAEGTLNVTGRHQATTNAKGEVSAGTTPGTKRWVLEGCTPR